MSDRPLIDALTFHRPGPEDFDLLRDVYRQTIGGWRKRRALRRMARKLHVHESDLLLALTEFLAEVKSELVEVPEPVDFR